MGATSRRDRGAPGSACFHFYEEGMSFVITPLEMLSPAPSMANGWFLILGQGAE
jgi:hypothetical protein